MLASRFVSFHQLLRSSAKFPVRFLSNLYENDLRTVHGKNLEEIARLCGCKISKLTPRIVKEKLTYKSVPEDQVWRLSLCSELKNLCDDALILPGFTVDETNQLLQFACVS